MMWPFRKTADLTAHLRPVTCHYSKDSLGTREERTKITSFIKKLSLPNKYKEIKEVEIKIVGKIPANTSILTAHKTWNSSRVPDLETPCGLPRAEIDAICSADSVLVEVCFLEKRSGGMGSYYGFAGFFLSMIMKASLTSVIDARGEEAQ